MSSVISLLEHLPATKDIGALCFEFLECLIDQVLYKFKSFKKQFILEFRLMEAIEHQYFADMNNVKLIEPIHFYRDQEYSDINVEEHQTQPASELMDTGDESQSGHRAANLIQHTMEQLLRNLNIEDDTNAGKEDMETKLNELLLSLTLKTPGEDYTEAMLTELLSSLKLKVLEEDVKGDEPSKDDLALTEMAAALTKLSLGVDSPDTFDRDLE